MVTTTNRAIVERIHEALKSTNQSPRAASIRAGLGPDAIRNLERDEAVLPRIDTLEKLAPVLELEPAELVGWRISAGRRQGIHQRGLKTKGEVAAGHWLEIDIVDEPRFAEDCPISFDPRYPEEGQYGLVVRGTSINKVAGPGEILHCVDLGISGLDPQQDDLVVVERRRAQAGQKEVTAKRYRTKGRLIELSPESNDKQWATPLLLDPKKAKEDEEVAVIAIVIGVYRPLKLRR